uniref:Uncharacterized protein n=1 Tax=Leptobrachium leishanense TaxID=445787 RepID=A0A8C5LPI2_9ANUR
MGVSDSSSELTSKDVTCLDTADTVRLGTGVGTGVVRDAGLGSRNLLGAGLGRGTGLGMAESIAARNLRGWMQMGVLTKLAQLALAFKTR